MAGAIAARRRHQVLGLHLRLLLDKGPQRVLHSRRVVLLEVLLRWWRLAAAAQQRLAATQFADAIRFGLGVDDALLGLQQADVRVVRQVQEVG